MKTKIIKVKGTWDEVLDDCRATVGKEELRKQPSTEWKKKILISEHSPIRDISIKWKWESIKSWIATHWSRHKFECFIKTQRTDRTGVNRDKLPQDAPVTFTGDANCQSLIDVMRKRLCFQASAETRKYAEDLKMTIRTIEPELADVLVPNCIYRGFCPELTPCGFFENYVKNLSKEELIKWQERYEHYNRLFYGKQGDSE